MLEPLEEVNGKMTVCIKCFPSLRKQCFTTSPIYKHTHTCWQSCYARHPLLIQNHNNRLTLMGEANCGSVRGHFDMSTLQGTGIKLLTLGLVDDHWTSWATSTPLKCSLDLFLLPACLQLSSKVMVAQRTQFILNMAAVSYWIGYRPLKWFRDPENKKSQCQSFLRFVEKCT